MMPSVLPRRLGRAARRASIRRFHAAIQRRMPRANASMSASAWSATTWLLASGAWQTRTWRACAALRSIFSKPTPKLAINSRAGNVANSSTLARRAVRHHGARAGAAAASAPQGSRDSARPWRPTSPRPAAPWSTPMADSPGRLVFCGCVHDGSAFSRVVTMGTKIITNHLTCIHWRFKVSISELSNTLDLIHSIILDTKSP